MKVRSKAQLWAELASAEKLVTALSDQNRALAGAVRVLSREVERLTKEAEASAAEHRLPPAFRRQVERGAVPAEVLAVYKAYPLRPEPPDEKCYACGQTLAFEVVGGVTSRICIQPGCDQAEDADWEWDDSTRAAGGAS